MIKKAFPIGLVIVGVVESWPSDDIRVIVANPGNKNLPAVV